MFGGAEVNPGIKGSEAPPRSRDFYIGKLQIEPDEQTPTCHKIKYD